MRKLILLMVVSFGFLFANQVKASSYHLDENALDQLFDNAVETSMLNNDATMSTSSASMSDYEVDGKDPIVAIVLDFFFGGLGVHRFYLGTETMSGIAYFLTCGGFVGIVPLIDLIVLAINYEDISPFVNNPKFFMWKDQF